MTMLSRIKNGDTYKRKFESNEHSRENERGVDGDGLNIIREKK